MFLWFKRMLDKFLMIKPAHVIDNPRPVKPKKEDYSDICDYVMAVNDFTKATEVFIRNQQVLSDIRRAKEL